MIQALRFPDFSKDGEWMNRKLGEMASKVGSGSTPLGGDSNYRETGIPFVRSQNVGWGELLLEDIAYISEEIHQSSINTEIEFGDVLLNITGASIGRSVVANGKVAGGNVNQHVCIIRTDKELLNPEFLCQYLISSLGQRQIDSFQAGGNRQGLNFIQIRSFSIPIPPLIQEQQKIASCLSSLDEVIFAHSQKLELLKDHKKGLMQNLFPQEGEKVPKYRFKEFQKDGEWVREKLGEVVNFFSGGTPSKEVNEYWNGDIPWISASSMHNPFIDKSELNVTHAAINRGSRLAKKGSLLILVRGSMLYKRIPICISTIDVAFNQDVKALEFKKDINNLFLLYHLYSFESKLLERVTATGIGAGKLDTEDLRKLTIFVPSKLEQRKIASCLSSLDALIIAQEEKVEQLKLHKKGLMQGLFPQIIE